MSRTFTLKTLFCVITCVAVLLSVARCLVVDQKNRQALRQLREHYALLICATQCSLTYWGLGGLEISYDDPGVEADALACAHGPHCVRCVRAAIMDAQAYVDTTIQARTYIVFRNASFIHPTAADLEALAVLPNLETLIFRSLAVRDQDISAICRLRSLRRLYLFCPNVSDEAIVKLKKQLPDCVVVTGICPESFQIRIEK